jgi:hypothetical protein
MRAPGMLRNESVHAGFGEMVQLRSALRFSTITPGALGLTEALAFLGEVLGDVLLVVENDLAVRHLQAESLLACRSLELAAVSSPSPFRAEVTRFVAWLPYLALAAGLRPGNVKVENRIARPVR